MKRLCFASLLLCLSVVAQSQKPNYKSLDPKLPIAFGGSYIVYKGDTVKLGPKAFFVDGQLTDAQASAHPYVFNSVNKAAEKLTDGTEKTAMTLYIAPYVYWIDNPD